MMNEEGKIFTNNIVCDYYPLLQLRYVSDMPMAFVSVLNIFFLNSFFANVNCRQGQD